MGGTPLDEIKRQHNESKRILENDYVCKPLEDLGEIPLKYKEKPTNLKISLEEKEHCVSWRGDVDISGILKLVTPGYDDSYIKRNNTLWDIYRAKTENVCMNRPSHDSWDIKKIVLIFCDDFVKNVYEFPWWHLNKEISFKNALNPVFETLNICSQQVVRLIFAAMPKDITIPLHHDTGEWVKHTHRIHIPILVRSNEVIFRVGMTDDCLERIPLIPGHMFEMNNQARHTVSNHSQHHRVHLILDYVDKKNIPRVLLSPGENLAQTRRSIDRLLDKGKRSPPSFIIIGAQKCGTTSIYNYMISHPLIVPPNRRETHCLDWRWGASKKHIESFYKTKQLRYFPSCLTGDSTPSYLLHSELVIPRMKKVFPWNPKLIVVLRDPVLRAISHYSMVVDPVATPQQRRTRGTEWLSLSFEQVIQQDIQKLKQMGLIPYWDDATNKVNYDIFHKFVNSKEETMAFLKYQKQLIPMHTGSHSLLLRGMYELQLRPWLQHEKDILILNIDNFNTSLKIIHQMNLVFRYLDLPQYEIPNMEISNQRNYKPIQESTRKLLKRFYQPHNMRLAFLGSEWKNIWNYTEF